MKAFYFFAWCFSILVQTAVAQTATPPVNAPHAPLAKLTVGIVDQDIFPYLFQANPGERAGYSKDWWQAWSQANATPVTLTYLSEASARKALLSGNIDLIDLSVDPVEDARLRVHAHKELVIALYAFEKAPQPHALKDQRIGIKAGDLCTAPVYASSPKVTAFDDYISLINGLVSNHVDAICMDSARAANLVSKLHIEQALLASAPIQQLKLHRIYRKDHPDLQHHVENGVLLIPAPTLESLNRQWFGAKKLEDLSYPLSVRILLGVFAAFMVGMLTIFVLKSKIHRATDALKLALKRTEEDFEKLEESHAYVHNIINAVPDLIFEISANKEKIRMINAPAKLDFSLQAFAVGMEEALREKQGFFKSIVERATANGMHKIQHLVVNVDHAPFSFEMAFVRKDNLKDLFPIIVFARDVTQKRIADLEQKLSASFFSNSHEAMCITSPTGEVVKVNQAFTTITGYTAEEIVGQNIHLLNSGKHDKKFFQDLWSWLETTGSWHGEIWNKKKSGDFYLEWLTISTIYDEQGAAQYRTAIFIDITEMRQAEQKLYHQANYDTVTGLPNRVNFNEAIETRIIDAAAQHSKFCLYFIDLDHFKEINDTMGHAFGDLLLQELSKRIAKTITPVKLYRFGGDEFLFLSAYIDDDFHQQIAQKILDELKVPFILKGEKTYISVSMGISYFPDHGKSSSALIKHADQALYAAKNLGRNQYVIFNEEFQNKAQKRKALLNDLRHACDGMDQFELHYQPIICMQTQSTIKAEALIRWNHPTLGRVSPAEFIPLAEETGLIIGLGNWVFTEAAKQARIWRETIHPEFQISINESPVQFAKAKEVHKLWFKLLSDFELPSNAIVLEITEGVMMDTSDKVNLIFDELKHKGIQIALDDFGTGFSSLSYLKKLDIDYLKIDQSFVRDLKHNKDDKSLCEAMIMMAHQLELKVIAEGVEDQETHAILRDMQCDFGQGYYYARPMPAREFLVNSAPNLITP